jgi:hypothetical protein
MAGRGTPLIADKRQTIIIMKLEVNAAIRYTDLTEGNDRNGRNTASGN